MNQSVFDHLKTVLQNLAAPGNQQVTTPDSSVPVANLEGNPKMGHALFYQADQPSISIPAKAQMQAPAVFQRPIGAKWNVNSEQNHIGQQSALNSLGIQLLNVPEEQTRTQLRAWQKSQ